MHGTLTGTAPNLIYSPATGFSGADSFTFEAQDKSLVSNVATVSIAVVAPPSSNIAELPAVINSTSFTLSWSGTDSPGGGGIVSYAIYESTNGGPFAEILTKTTATSTTINGAYGQSYGFFSVATDKAGFTQPTPSTAQATTTLGTPPPPLVTVQAVQVETVKIGKKKVKEILVDFSGALEAGPAQSLANYQLISSGKSKKFGTKTNKPVALKSATYNPATDSVSLLTRSTLVLTDPLKLTVNGSGLLDTLGRQIDGGDDGQPGGYAVAVLTSRGATVTSAVPAAMQAKPSARLVDELLDGDELSAPHCWAGRSGPAQSGWAVLTGSSGLRKRRNALRSARGREPPRERP